MTARAWDGAALHALAAELYPICRSITGAGVRETLAIIGRHVPLEIHEIPSGTRVFDWEIPREWNVRDAWIKDDAGRKVVDFAAHNLHLVSYSRPVHRRLSLAELRPHLHTLPGQPDLIPYRTSYYREDWGFCLSQRQLDGLRDGTYEVWIDSTLEDGALSYAELVIPGASEREFLFYTHICHPSLCNDNLSGIVVCTALAAGLLGTTPRYTYRFVFGPGTIGSIAWLAGHEAMLGKIAHGLVAVLLGGPGRFTYKASRHGEREIDRIVRHALEEAQADHGCEPFTPYGYDERQFGSPGIDLPVGRLTRSANATFPEYHTSADDLAFVSPRSLEESLRLCERIVGIAETDRRYVNLQPRGEPQLGRRGLYRAAGGPDIRERELALLWVLNQSDGTHSLLDIAQRSGMPYATLLEAARDLEGAALLAATPD